MKSGQYFSGSAHRNYGPEGAKAASQAGSREAGLDNAEASPTGCHETCKIERVMALHCVRPEEATGEDAAAVTIKTLEF